MLTQFNWAVEDDGILLGIDWNNQSVCFGLMLVQQYVQINGWRRVPQH